MTSLPVSFCDWLDVTFAPDDCPYPELNLLLLECDFEVSRDSGGCVIYLPPQGRGVAKVTHASRYAKVSFSGGICEHLRSIGRWEEALSILGTSPHKVTRIDLAVDFPLDAAGVIADLRARYPSGKVNIGRKALDVTAMLSVRSDGAETGTWYVGHRSAARQTLRVYDKAFEQLQKYGYLLPPTTRVEVTSRKDSGATLRDAVLCDALFWHIASPSVFKLPEGVPVWVPNTEMGFEFKRREITPAEVLKRRVENSPELEVFLSVADSMGGEGRAYLLHLLQKRVLDASEGVQDVA